MEWQPIETAPEDVVLAWHKDWLRPEVIDLLDFGPAHQPVGWNKTFPSHWAKIPTLPTPPST